MPDFKVDTTKRLSEVAALLPIHPLQRDRMDLFRAAALIKSLIKNNSMSSLSSLIIVAPEQAMDTIRALVALYSGQGSFEIVSEADLFSDREISEMSSIGGWHRQQIIKLACPRLTSHQCVLTLDSDVLNFGPLKLSDLAPNGGIPTQFGAQFDAWKQGSAELLQVLPPDLTMGVTPAFLSRDIILELHKILAQKGTGWLEVLCDASKAKIQWTEYMLYQMAGLRTGLWDQMHVESSKVIYRGAWRNTKLNEDFFGKLVSEEPIFFVNQSVRSDSDEVHADLHRRGLPSLYDLDTKSLEHLFSSINQSVSKSPRRSHNEILMQDVEQIVVNNKGNDTISLASSDVQAIANAKRPIAMLLKHLLIEDFSTSKEILSQMYVPESASLQIVELYYHVLLNSSGFVLLVSDVLWRIGNKSMSSSALERAILGLSHKGEFTFVSRILLAARRHFWLDQKFHLMVSNVYSIAGKQVLVEMASKRAHSRCS